jgi:hypothetical protein
MEADVETHPCTFRRIEGIEVIQTVPRYLREGAELGRQPASNF